MNVPLVDLGGKVALVTGAASGIGREIAGLFHTLGAQIMMTDINEAGLQDIAGQLGHGVLTQQHDVSREDDWARVFDAANSTYGRLDILVNNAGVMMAKPFPEAGIEVLRRQLRINVESVYLGMHGALPLMRAALEGGARSVSIINIASVYGKVAGNQFAAYSATKGAVRMLSKAVAAELAASGIRVNTILPGPVATNLGADWEPQLGADGKPLSEEAVLAAWAKLIPMGRLGTTPDIAPLAAFLASDAAAFVTGAEFVADGGYTAV